MVISWHYVSPGMGIFDDLGCWCCFVVIFPHSGTTWFKIHEYCNSLNFFFTITDFALAVHVLEESGRKHFSFKHASMVLYIFIIVVFQVSE